MEIVDINFSGLFAALFSKRIEFTVNPLNITAERAERMLYTEPFFATGNGFLVRAADTNEGASRISRASSSRSIAAPSPTPGQRRTPRSTASRSSATTPSPTGVQAVITRRAFTALNEIPTAVFAASQNKADQGRLQRLSTAATSAIAFRLESTTYRNTVEGAIECMKKDGTLVKMYEKWYGSKPDAASSINTVFPGYGAPGFKGYDATPHELSCK